MKNKKMMILGGIIGVMATCFFCLEQENTYIAMNSIMSGTSEAYITYINVVVDNSQKLSSQEMSEDIMVKYLDNELETMFFDFEEGYPDNVNVTVYSSEDDYDNGVTWFSFSANQDEEYSKYNITL
ncbi:MAG: hypothetical protein R3Y40_04000 [Eubacteriales bacterium]